jgi:hypothetical protein
VYGKNPLLETASERLSLPLPNNSTGKTTTSLSTLMCSEGGLNLILFRTFIKTQTDIDRYWQKLVFACSKFFVKYQAFCAYAFKVASSANMTKISFSQKIGKNREA